MSVSNSAQFRIEKLKKQAKSLRKNEGLSPSESLDIIAKNHGFQSWFDCRSQILKGDTKLKIQNKKVFSHEFEPSIHSTENVRGVFSDDIGGYHIKTRTSILNYVSESFETINSFRNRLESEIRNVITRSKQHVSIDIIVFLNSETLNMIKNTDDFFDAILDRYERLNELDVKVRDNEISMNEFQHILDSIAGPSR